MELKGKKDDSNGAFLQESCLPHEPGASADVHACTQKCVRGNILVMPQNSTNLTTMLPLPPEVICDTICAVFVGQAKPTKDTIGKLGPLLVHKSHIL